MQLEQDASRRGDPRPLECAVGNGVAAGVRGARRWESSKSRSDLLDLDTALEELASLDPRGSQVVELKFFGGLTMEKIAHRLDFSLRTIEGDWRHARAWLSRRLTAR